MTGAGGEVGASIGRLGEWLCGILFWRILAKRVIFLKTVVGLGYDVQGNLANENGQKYTFDYGNRLWDVTGKESYRYDGLGRRVLAWSSKLGNIVSVYTKDGQLWYQNDQRRPQVQVSWSARASSCRAKRSQPISHVSRS